MCIYIYVLGTMQYASTLYRYIINFCDTLECFLYVYIHI